MSLDGLSRVVQGIATGIGFLGGGTILKLAQDEEVKGLTTAAGIWMAAAIGIAVGVGRLGTAFLATLFAFVILSLLQRVERRILPHYHAAKSHGAGGERSVPVNE
jgi:putative Mg2+ transporter-C (MgtC) family protein